MSEEKIDWPLKIEVMGEVLEIHKPGHTPEPWSQKMSFIRAEKRNITIVSLGGAPSNEDIQNARRIVACVNFLRGMETEKLEFLFAKGMDINVMMEELVAKGAQIATAQMMQGMNDLGTPST